MQHNSIATLLLADESDTVRLGQSLAEVLLPGDTVLLDGALGIGKSTLARAVLRSLSGDRRLNVPSPTYTLAQAYDLPSGIAHHIDLFRLDGPEDCVELGLEDVFGMDLALVEWPDRLGHNAPEEWVRVRLVPGDRPGSRLAELMVTGSPALLDRLQCAVRRYRGYTHAA